jgi:hypothetical protein
MNFADLEERCRPLHLILSLFRGWTWCCTQAGKSGAYRGSPRITYWCANDHRNVLNRIDVELRNPCLSCCSRGNYNHRGRATVQYASQQTGEEGRPIGVKIVACDKPSVKARRMLCECVNEQPNQIRTYIPAIHIHYDSSSHRHASYRV